MSYRIATLVVGMISVRVLVGQEQERGDMSTTTPNAAIQKLISEVIRAKTHPADDSVLRTSDKTMA